MCLTIPGRVVRVDGESTEAPTALVDFEGTMKTVSLLYLPGIQPGEYLLSQAGFAIARVPREEAEAALELARRPIPAADPAATTEGS